jgi:hypothetical protein
MNSTLCSFNKEQRSAKSFRTSTVVRASRGFEVFSSQTLHFRDALLPRPAQPISQYRIRATLLAKGGQAKNSFHVAALFEDADTKSQAIELSSEVPRSALAGCVRLSPLFFRQTR